MIFNMGSKFDKRIKILRSQLEKSMNNLKDYYILELQTLAEMSQYNDLYILSRFFKIIQKDNGFIEEDIKHYLSDNWFMTLSNRTKNHYLTCIKKYLIFSEYPELAKKLPNFKTKNKELSRNDLISRDDLQKIVSLCNTKKKCMFMMLYEGALRKDELINVRRKDIGFEGRIVNMFIPKSKTKERNLPLVDSVPFIKEYFSENNFKPDEILFNIVGATINDNLKTIGKILKEKYPGWNKYLYPHLFRHSRLTELGTFLTENQLCLFAGFELGSKMVRKYVHLDTSDIKSILLGEKYEKPKPKIFEIKICEICNAENNEARSYCWNCKDVFDKSKLITERIDEQEKLKIMSEKINKLEKAYETILESIQKNK